MVDSFRASFRFGCECEVFNFGSPPLDSSISYLATRCHYLEKEASTFVLCEKVWHSCLFVCFPFRFPPRCRCTGCSVRLLQLFLFVQGSIQLHCEVLNTQGILFQLVFLNNDWHTVPTDVIKAPCGLCNVVSGSDDAITDKNDYRGLMTMLASEIMNTLGSLSARSINV